MRGLQCFIGNCATGDQTADIKRIAEWGSSFPLNAAKQFWPHYFKTKKKR